MKHITSLALVAALLAPVPASADIIEVTFTGTIAFGQYVASTLPLVIENISGDPFTAVYVFDTSLGTVSPGMLTGGLVNATFTTDQIGFGGPSALFFNVSSLIWQGDISNVQAANAGLINSFFHLNMTQTSGSFQFGTCPGLLRPCGTANVESVTAVPGPMAGAGLPGLLLATLGWLGWRRRLMWLL
jgi:hypothetical protein